MGAGEGRSWRSGRQATGWSAWRATAAAAAAAASGSPRYAAGADRQVVVEEHAVRDARRDLELRDVRVGDPLEVLAEGPDAVAVRGDEHGAALLGGGAQVGQDVRLPVGRRAPHDVGQALGAGDVRRVDVPVAGITGDVEGVVRRQRRGRRVVAAPPGQQLRCPELLLDLGLVLPLQVPVVALVEAPVTAHRDPAATGRGEGELRRADGPGQDRGVEHPEVEGVVGVRAGLGQQLPAGAGLGLPSVGQAHVDPAREQVLRVPGGLAVAEEDQVKGGRGGHASIVGPRGGGRSKACPTWWMGVGSIVVAIPIKNLDTE